MNWDRILEYIKEAGRVGIYAKTIKQKFDLDIQTRYLGMKLKKKVEEIPQLERKCMKSGKGDYKYFWRPSSSQTREKKVVA